MNTLAYSTSTEQAAELVAVECAWCPRAVTVEASRVSPQDPPWVCGTCEDWG